LELFDRHQQGFHAQSVAQSGYEQPIRHRDREYSNPVILFSLLLLITRR
jgi:hypothetical protein